MRDRVRRKGTFFVVFISVFRCIFGVVVFTAICAFAFLQFFALLWYV